MNRAVFLDRDGVINALVERDGKLASPRIATEFKLLPGAQDAISIIRSLGYKCIVVTNQPDISRGLMTISELEKMSQILKERFVDIVIKVCIHDDVDQCVCRKPKPGLITQALQEFNIDSRKSWMVGDRVSDVEAGVSAGCSVAFITSGQDEDSSIDTFDGVEIFPNLLKFAENLELLHVK